MTSLTAPTRLSGFYFFYYAIVGTFMPYWSLYLEDQGFSFQDIGLLSSIALLTRFFAPMIWGWIADKSGKRMLLVRIATWMEACIWFLVFIIHDNFQSVALLMFIFSFFQNAILAQFEGVTLFWLGEKSSKLYGKIRKWGSIGFIIAVFGIGALLEIIKISWLPILLLSIAFLAFIWSFTIQEPNEAPKSQKTLESIYPILKNPVVAAFFAIEFILLFSHAPFYSFYSNFLAQSGFSTTEIGFLWSIGVIAEILMFAYANLFMQKISFRYLVLMCLLLTGFRWVIVGVFSTFFLAQFLAQLIHSFSFGLFHLLAMQVIFKKFNLAQQGRGQAFYSTVWGIGVALGSILAGTYWDILSGKMIFIYAGGITLSCLFFIKFLPNKKLAEI